MERKTLLYQPSGQADKRSYTQVNAPAGAFGDAGGAMAGFGRDVQGLGGSVAQIGRNMELKQELKIREDQDRKRKGLEAVDAAFVHAESVRLAHENAASGEGFDATEQGRSRVFIDKEAQKYLDGWKKENKWEMPQTEEHLKDFEIQSETLRNRVLNGYARQDNTRQITLRTDTEENSTRETFARTADQGYQGAFSAFHGNLERLNASRGIDKNKALKTNLDTFSAALAKNPLPYTASDEERKGIHDDLIDYGLSPAFAASYTKKDEPKLTRAEVNDQISTLITNGGGSPEQLKDIQAKVDYLASKGTATTYEQKALVPIAVIESDIRYGSNSPLGLDRLRVEAILKHENMEDPRDLAAMFGDNAKDLNLEDLKRLRNMAVASAKQTQNMIQKDPAAFIEYRNSTTKDLGSSTLTMAKQLLVSDSGSTEAVKKSLSQYSSSVVSQLTDMGYPPEPGASYIPVGLTDLLAENGREGRLDMVTQAFEPSVVRLSAKAALANNQAVGAHLAVFGSLPSFVYQSTKPSSPVAAARNATVQKIQAEFADLGKITSVKRDGFKDIYTKQPGRSEIGTSGRGAEDDLTELYNKMPAQGKGFNAAGFLMGTPVQETTETTLRDTVEGLANSLGLDDTGKGRLHDQVKDLILKDASSRGAGKPALALHDATVTMAKRLKDLGLLTTKLDDGSAITMYMPVEGLVNQVENALFMRKDNQIESIKAVEEGFGHTVVGLGRQFSKGLLAERINGGIKVKNWWHEVPSTRNLGLPFKHDMGPGLIGKSEFAWAIGDQIKGAEESGLKELASLGGATLHHSYEHGGLVVTVPPGIRTSFFDTMSVSGAPRVLQIRKTGKPLVIPSDRVNTLTQYVLEFDSKTTSRGLASVFHDPKPRDPNRHGFREGPARSHLRVLEELNQIHQAQSKFLSP